MLISGSKRSRSCVLAALLVSALAAWCADSTGRARREIRGEPIVPLRARNLSNTVPQLRLTPLTLPPPRTNDAGFRELGFDLLGSFPFTITNDPADNSAGRPLTKPLGNIPPEVKALDGAKVVITDLRRGVEHQVVKALDGAKVVITGYALPLRMKSGMVTEFLLTRDAGDCCFGDSPQVNHWVRVKMKGAGIDGGYEPQAVSGTLRVGEIYVQGYFTGIYQMEGEGAEVAKDAAR